MLDTIKNIDKTIKELEEYFDSIEVDDGVEEMDLSYLDE